MNFINPYFTEKEKIDALQRWILVQSFLYYETDLQLVTDKVYDDNCKQLVGYQNEFRKAFKSSMYYYVFHDFDGSTGFDLYYRLNKEDKERLDLYIGNILYRNGGVKTNGKSKKKKNR
jgi:hypothetical protein